VATMRTNKDLIVGSLYARATPAVQYHLEAADVAQA
jgi:hypothetical protein